MINLGKNSAGVEFAARIIRKGDNYGRNNCLVHTEEKPLVEFHDMDAGMFVARYYVETLTGESEWSNGDSRVHGIDLHCGVDKWFVSGAQVQTALIEF